MANLLIDVLRSCILSNEMKVHEFVVMPDHVHVLLSIPGNLSLEKTMQLIKGRFSFQASRILGFKGEIWQRGFSDVRITDDLSFQRHRDYIILNPVRAGLAAEPETYAHGSAYLKAQKRAGLKPGRDSAILGTAEVLP
jgi:putative transposase